jgi:hypothetical protein
MNDEQIRPLLKAWLRARSAGPADVPDGVAQVVARLPQTRQRSRWWPLPAFERPGPIPVTSERSPGRAFTVTSTLKFAVAGVMVALFGGLLLASILTTRQGAEPLPGAVSETATGALASCPAGSTPDQPGPADQARPPGGDDVAVAFDRGAGQLVYHVAKRGIPETWTLDVCTNTWALAQRGDGPGTGDRLLDAVYDERAGVTVAVDGAESDAGTWTFDLSAAAWTERQTPPFPDALPVRLTYDRDAGRTVALSLQRPFRMWTYDATADEWHPVVPAEPLPSHEYAMHVLATYDRSVDRLLTYHLGHAALFDTATGAWETVGTRSPAFVYGGYLSYGGEIVHDEASGWTVLISDGLVIAYDAAAGDWATLWGEERGEYVDGGIAVEDPVRGPLGGTDHHLAFDPVNDRIILVGGSTSTLASRAPRQDVWAFDAVNGEWTELVPASDEREVTDDGKPDLDATQDLGPLGTYVITADAMSATD